MYRLVGQDADALGGEPARDVLALLIIVIVIIHCIIITTTIIIITC